MRVNKIEIDVVDNGYVVTVLSDNARGTVRRLVAASAKSADEVLATALDAPAPYPDRATMDHAVRRLAGLFQRLLGLSADLRSGPNVPISRVAALLGETGSEGLTALADLTPAGARVDDGAPEAAQP